MESNGKYQQRERARIAIGLMVVAAGAALLMRNLGYFIIPSWLFTWPVILIMIGIYSGIKHNFQNNTWIILIGIGGFFLVNSFMPELKLEPAFWPLVIIGIGIFYLVRPGKKIFPKERVDVPGYNIAESIKTSAGPQSDNKPGEGDFLRIDSVFSGVNRTVISKNFQGGRVSCVFGGSEIDLLKSDIVGSATIRMDIVFGGAKIIVPANWTVQNDMDGIFHNVEDKRKYNSIVSTDPARILILKGTAVFGGVEIRSY